MKLKKHIDSRIVVSGLIIALGATLFFCVFNNLSALTGWIVNLLRVFSPVTGGIMVAYLLRPIARFIEEKVLFKIKSQKARIHISGLSSVFLFLVLLIFLIRIVLPQITSSISNLVANFDAYYASARTQIADHASRITFLDIDVEKLIGSSDDLFRKLSKWLSQNVSQFIDIFYQFSSFLVNFVIIVAMACYALLDRKNIKAGLLKLENATLGQTRTQRLNEIVNRGDRLMTTFLGSNLLDAAIVGIINFIFLTIFKAPYSVLLSVLLGVFNFVPTFGPIAGGIIAAVIVLLTKPELLVGFVIFTIILQQLDGNVVKPVLFGDSTGLSPFWVLVAIVVGGGLFGVLGMILGVPVLALVFSVFQEVLDRKAKQAPPAPPAE